MRQATVELVGKYVLQQPSLLDAYYHPLRERLMDKGVSVRKTVVKFLGEFLQRCPTHPLRTEICRCLIERASVVKEEDTVKDLIQDAFQVMWFSVKGGEDGRELGEEEGGEEAMVENGEEGEKEEGAGAWRKKKLSDSERLAAVGLQMVEVIAGLNNTDWLVAVMTGLLFGPGEGEQGKKDRVKQRKIVTTRCGLLVESLVNVLLDLDEGGHPPLNTALPELATPAKQLLGVIATLHVFSRADPRFLVPHVDTLLPYLKGENHLDLPEEAALCCKISQMVGLVLPHLTHPDQGTFAQVSRDLVQITYRFGAAAIHAAIQCLANVCTFILGGDAGPVLGLANTFYRVLVKFRERPTFAVGEADFTTRSSTHRALVVLGCVCRYYPGFQPPAGASEGALPLSVLDAPLAEEVDEGNVYVMGYRLLTLYLTKDLETETKAVQALCCLFTGCMPLMLTAQRDHVVGRMLTTRGGVARGPVRLQALKSLKEVLLAEETRVESGAARVRMAQAGVTLKQRVKGDQDAEASIVGGVVQEHLDAIKHLLFDRDVHLRTAALGLLSVLHRQGLVNPLQTLPALIALQADPSPGMRMQAYRQVLVEHEKHPEFLPARIMEGVSLSFTFQRKVLGKGGGGVSAVLPVEGGREGGGGWGGGGRQCFLGTVYATCVRGNRKHRYLFLRNLLSLFEEKTARDVHAKIHRQQRQQQHHFSTSSSSFSSSSTARRTSTGISMTTADPKGQKGSLDPLFLAYIAQILAFLPFDVQEEPLFLIHAISRTVSLEGATLVGEIKGLLRKVEKAGGRTGAREGGKEGGGSSDEEDEDEVEAVGGDGGAAAGSPPASRSVLLDLLKGKAGTAMSLCLLLNLKHWLKNVYGFGDERCQEFRPILGGVGGGAKGERPLSKPDCLPDLPLPAWLLEEYPREGGEEEVLRVVRGQYREFSTLVKQDPSDFVLTQTVRIGGAGGGGGGGGGGRRGSGGRGRRGSVGGGAGSRVTGGRGGGGGGKRKRGKGGGGGKGRAGGYEGESDSADEGVAGSDSDEDGARMVY